MTLPDCARRFAATLLLGLAAAALAAPSAAALPDTIERLAPAIVAVGTHAPLRQPSAEFHGTGFVVGDGRHVLTNYHVLPAGLDARQNEVLSVFSGEGRQVQRRGAEVVAEDARHDLVLLRITGEALPALRFGDALAVRAGERYAFTGFPIGMVLGLHPVTHQATVSALTPIAIPQPRARSLDAAQIRHLADPYRVFQLDGTAYPGNSGSPLYDPDTGAVIGIVNMVFVKGKKERVLQEPSGIAYAIPAHHAEALLAQALDSSRDAGAAE